MGLPIIKIIALFPLLLPVWKERPLEHTDIYPSEYPIKVQETDVSIQQEGLQYGNRTLRGTIYRHLREMDLPASRQLLADSLKTESDPRLRATILQQLSLCSTVPDVPLASLGSYLKSKDSDVRYWAIRLAGKIESVPAKQLIDLAASDPTRRLRAAACLAMQDRDTQLPPAALRSLWKHTDPHVRATAFAASLLVGGAAKQPARIPAKAFADAVPVRDALARAIASATPEDARSLVPPLAKDSHASVRAQLAKSLGERQDTAYLPTLLALVPDPDPDVRRQAAESLAVFPTTESRDALVGLFADPRTLVRRQAEDSLVIIHPASPVDKTAGKLLNASQAYTRFHVFRLLGRLDSRQFAKPIAARLPQETEPVNIAAAVFALGQFEARFAADAIARLATHKDPGVRTDVGRALGRLAVPKTYPTIQKLAFDKEDDVRQAAILGMGWIADGKAFNPTLLKVLKSVREGQMSSPNRSAAVWAAGRTRPLALPLAKRLVVQATTPVVPGPMGEMLFEPDYLLASCDFALAQMARDDKSFFPQFKAVNEPHGKVFPPNTEPPTGTIKFSAEVVEYARQAKAYLNHTTIAPLPRPTRRKIYDYGLYNPAKNTD
jgi:HEAT repeat protein